MKKIVFALSTIVALSGTAFGGDVLEFKRGVKFPHKKHQEMLKDCKKCHEKAPGKIEGFGKDFAHKTCKGCHADMQKGPVFCKDCHKA
jgi:hypothetical protein